MRRMRERGPNAGTETLLTTSSIVTCADLSVVSREEQGTPAETRPSFQITPH